jgi:hypothetical protein
MMIRAGRQLTRALLLCTMVSALSSARLGAQWVQAPPSQDVMIRGGWLFDGIRDTRVRNTGIVIRGGTFTEIGTDLTGASTAGARVIDLDDTMTILPGMFDLHAHINMNLVGEGRAEDVTYNPILFLANGVTSTWSGGEFIPHRVIEARDRIDRGEAVGSRLFASGPYFGAFRCEYSIETAEDDCPGWPNGISERQIRAEVDYWADRGVRSIKIKQSTPEEMRILIDQAHQRGMTTTSHLSNYAGGYDVGLNEAIRMGLDRVEHWSWGRGRDPSEVSEMIDMFLAYDVFFTANLQMAGRNELRSIPELEMVWVDEIKFFTPYVQRLIRERRSALPEIPAPSLSNGTFRRMVALKALYEAGGGHLILVGTDEPTSGCTPDYRSPVDACGPLLPGFAYHRELQALVYAGLPPVAALKAATINGARALSVEDRLGSIEPGKLADLYIVEGNPLDDIKAARDVRFVLKNGEVYDPQDLLTSAEGKIGPSGPSDHDYWRLRVEPLVRLP